jgi:hypothetical protein
VIERLQANTNILTIHLDAVLAPVQAVYSSKTMAKLLTAGPDDASRTLVIPVSLEKRPSEANRKTKGSSAACRLAPELFSAGGGWAISQRSRPRYASFVSRTASKRQ